MKPSDEEKKKVQKQDTKDSNLVEGTFKKPRKRAYVSHKRKRNIQCPSLGPTSVKMAIITDNFPTVIIAQKMVCEIQGILMKMIRAKEDPLPIVDVGNVVDGAMHVTCRDRSDADWLMGLDGNVVEGITLKVIDAKDFPNPVKMAWKTKHDHPNNTIRSLKRLQRLNPQLKTDQWNVVDTSIDGNQVRRIVIVNKASADVIKAANYALPDGNGISYFRVLDRSRKKNSPNSTPIATEIVPKADSTMQLEIKEIDKGQMNHVISDLYNLANQNEVLMKIATLHLSNAKCPPDP